MKTSVTREIDRNWHRVSILACLTIWLLPVAALGASPRGEDRSAPLVPRGLPELIFADDFELGNASLWSKSRPFAGVCPTGQHVVHATGLVGIFDPDGFDPASDWAEYSCEPDQTCRAGQCGSNGVCLERRGQAVCACQPGYAGRSCERCATGYEPDGGRCVLGPECGERLCSGQGSCVADGPALACKCDPDASGRFCENGGPASGPLRPPTRIEVAGNETSIEPGETRELEATLFGGGNVDNRLQWRVLSGPGLLLQSTGPAVTFQAPADVDPDGVTVTTIRAHAECCPDEPVDLHLTLTPGNGIPVSGAAHPELEPVDDAIVLFMKYRCIGAATLGISRYGETIYLRGYGNLAGAPTDDPVYLADCGDQVDVSGLFTEFPLPGPSQVQPNTPMRIGSNSKAIGAAIVRQRVKELVAAVTAGPEPDDDTLEDLLLTDPLLQLMPPEPLAVANGTQPPPVPLSSLSGARPNCSDDDPCPYGGSCAAVIGEGNACIGCPAGRAGWDCSIDLAHCPNLSVAADDRWSQVTLGHLLGHRAGLPRSAPSLTGVLYPGFHLFRNLQDAGDWLAEEVALTTDTGFPAGDFATEFPLFPAGQSNIGSSIFVPRATVWEAVLSRQGACLAYTPGSSGIYTNTGYALLGVLAEHITGIPMAGKDGKPGLHTGSLLETFLAEELGVPLPGQATSEGIFYSQNNLSNRHPEEPLYRQWDGGGGTYYPLDWDAKRPFCRPSGDDCSFDDWIANPAGSRTRFDWDFNWDAVAGQTQRTLRPFSGGGAEGSGAEGGFSAEPEVMLRFMAKYWVGGGGGDPDYGETRCPGGLCIWNDYHTHTGARGGSFSRVYQLGGGSATLTLPPIAPSGLIVDDFVNVSSYPCELPEGVDVFFAVNTRSDKKCAEDPDVACDDAHGLASHFLLYGICNVDWPHNPFVLWPADAASPAPVAIDF